MNKHKEIRFEEAIEADLLAKGYQAGDAKRYDAERALFPDDVIAFLQASQPKKWEGLAGLQGEAVKETVLNSLTKEFALKGALHVLRHGFKCFGKTFQLAAFAPASSMNPEAWEEYRKNILRVTRQVRFSPPHPHLSVDLVLSVNGLPVATLELKNPLSGQNVEDAKRQYQFDRDPREPLFKFKERALVHFAADPDLVFMTTRLAGKETHWLPFNRGQNLGAGNPPAEDGNYRTAYLWEEVLSRDGLLDILARFVHLQVDEKQVMTGSGRHDGV